MKDTDSPGHGKVEMKEMATESLLWPHNTRSTTWQPEIPVYGGVVHDITSITIIRSNITCNRNGVSPVGIALVNPLPVNSQVSWNLLPVQQPLIPVNFFGRQVKDMDRANFRYCQNHIYKLPYVQENGNTLTTTWLAVDTFAGKYEANNYQLKCSAFEADIIRTWLKFITGQTASSYEKTPTWESTPIVPAHRRVPADLNIFTQAMEESVRQHTNAGQYLIPYSDFSHCSAVGCMYYAVYYTPDG